MVLEDSLDLKKQRLLLLVSLYTVLAFVVYTYLYDILVLLVLIVTLWFIYDLIKSYTKEYVDPSGKYVYITGCDSGNLFFRLPLCDPTPVFSAICTEWIIEYAGKAKRFDEC